MKNILDIGFLNMQGRDDAIPEPNLTTTNEYVCHCSKNFDDLSVLNVGDKITLYATNSSSGYGLYWSTRREFLYGETCFALKGITARRILSCDIYDWYRTGDMEVVIDEIDEEEQLVFISLA